MVKETKAALTAEAESLGIDVDGRWGIETLQEKIDAAKAAKAQEGQGDAAEKGKAEGEDVAGSASAPGDGGSQAGDAGGEATDGTAVAGESSGAADPVAAPAGTADGLEQGDKPDGDHAAAETVAADAGTTEGQGDEGGDTIEGQAVPRDPESELPAVSAGNASASEDVSSDIAEGGSPIEGGTAHEADAAPGLAGKDDAADQSPAASGDTGEAASDAPEAGDDDAGSTGAAHGDPEDDRSDDGASAGAGDLVEATGEPNADAGPADTSHPGAPAPSVASDDEEEYAAARRAMTWPMLAAFQAASSVRGIARGEQTGGFALDMGWMPGEDAPDKIITLVRHAAPFVRTWPDAPPEALYGHVASGGGVNLVLDVAWADLDLADRASWTVFRDTLVTLDRFLRDAALTEARVDDRPSYPASADDLTLEEADERFAPSAFGRGEP